MRTVLKVILAIGIAGAAGWAAQTFVAGHGPTTIGASLPTGAAVLLRVAGPLAVSPDGRLYVADTAADRILVRMPSGKFSVAVGDGREGFSGDGGPAIDAELTKVTDMASAPDGSLYVADGPRVRVVAPDGIITTVAGDGEPARYSSVVADGTPALAAALPGINGLSIAISRHGVLYIATGMQVLHLENGRLEAVRNRITSGYFAGKQLSGFGQVAVDGRGDVDVSGFNGWAIWQISPTGEANELTADSAEARRSGGNTSVLERAPDGSVYGEGYSSLLHLVGQHVVAGFSFTRPVHGDYFWLTYFAFAPSGAVYADEIPGGGGFEREQQLVSETDGQVSLLWQQGNG